MDIIAHSLSGMLLAQITAPKQEQTQRKYYIGISVIALIFPDVDAITYPFGVDVFASIHQRYTHTIFSLLLLPPFLAWMTRLFYKKIPYVKLWLLFLGGFVIHICEDLIAHWPVAFFYPLSQKGWAFGLIRKDFSLVVDFIFIIGSMLTFYDKMEKHRQIVAYSTFLLVFLYLLFGPGF